MFLQGHQLVKKVTLFFSWALMFLPLEMFVYCPDHNGRVQGHRALREVCGASAQRRVSLLAGPEGGPVSAQQRSR